MHHFGKTAPAHVQPQYTQLKMSDSFKTGTCGNNTETYNNKPQQGCALVDCWYASWM